MMPVFPGALWVPKFGGPESELKYGDWKEQLRGIVQYGDLTEPCKVGILMGALTGVAKRQINVYLRESVILQPKSLLNLMSCTKNGHQCR